jgi:hypothetical protein
MHDSSPSDTGEQCGDLKTLLSRIEACRYLEADISRITRTGGVFANKQPN